VNFIHQKDAYIVMSVIETMQIINAPVCTVHDNFISTATYYDLLPSIYSNVIREIRPPLLMINDLIYMNIIKPVLRSKGAKELIMHHIMKITFGRILLIRIYLSISWKEIFLLILRKMRMHTIHG